MCKDCLKSTFTKDEHHCENNESSSNTKSCCENKKSSSKENLPEEDDESNTSGNLSKSTSNNATSCCKKLKGSEEEEIKSNIKSCCKVDEDLISHWPSIFRDTKWDIILSLTIGLPLIINFISMLIGHHLIWENKYLFFILATILVFFTLPKKLYGAYHEIKERTFSHTILQVFAIASVYIYSSIVVIFNLDMKFDFDCLAFILIIFAIADIVEKQVIDNINKNIANETKVTQTSKVSVFKNGVEVKIWPNELKIGDHFLIKKGQQVPVDAQIISSDAIFDTSAISGEVKPYTPQVNELVLSGSVNKGQVVTLQVTKLQKDSLLATLDQELKNLQAKSTPTYKLGQKFLRWILISIILVSLINFGVQWYLFGFEKAILTSIAVILITCPCGIAAGLPLLFSIYMSQLLKHKILVRDLIFIEKIKSIKSYAFDKTGTITSSVSSVYEIVGDEKYLPYLNTIEKYSSHPIAKSIVNYMNNKQYSEISFETINEISGLGIFATINNDKIYVGSKKLMQKQNIKILDAQNDQLLATKGFIIIYLAVNKEIKLKVILNSKLLPKAKELINKLNAKSNTYLITGDNQQVGEYIAKKANIKQAFCNVTPLNKLDIIKKIQTKEPVLYVGDGINDSLSLQQADLSISFSNGSDIAKQSAKAILLNEDLSLIAKLVDYSKVTSTNMYQAMWITYIYNIITMTLAVLSVVSLEFAPFAEVISVVIIFVNVYRLKWKAKKIFNK